MKTELLTNEDDYDFNAVEVTEPEAPKKKKRKIEKQKQPEEPEIKKKDEGIRTQFGIWAGNLSYSTTETMLREYFGKCGEISRVKMPLNKGKNKGFVYIDFSTEEAMNEALNLTEKQFDGRTLLIKRSNDFEAAGRKPRGGRKPRKQSDQKSRRIFIGNISFETSRDALKKLFEQFGKMDEFRVAEFEDSGKCKGYAFVTFTTEEEAEKAVQAHLLKLNGRILRVEFAQRDQYNE